MTEALPLFRIKTDTAPKTGQNAVGGIAYTVLRDELASTVFIFLLSNSSGGYFNREPVRLADIRRCLEGVDTTRPIPAKTFTRAFRGKSVNNAGFLCAVLRHEGLLAPAPDAAYQHILADEDWSNWATAMLALPAEPFVPPTKTIPETSETEASQPPGGAPDTAETPAPEHKKDRKGRRHAADRVTTASSPVEEAPDANPA